MAKGLEILNLERIKTLFRRKRLQRLGREVEMLILLEHRVARKYKGRVHLIYGRESSSNPYAQIGDETDRLYMKFFPAGYAVDIVPVELLSGILTKKIIHV